MTDGKRLKFGWLAALLLTVLTMGVSGGVQTGVLAAVVRYARSSHPGVSHERLAETLMWDGAVFSTFVILSSLAGTLTIALWIRWLKGPTFKEYLGLNRFPTLRDWGVGAGCLLMLGLATSVMPLIFEEPDVPEYMVLVFQSASGNGITLAALIFGVAVAGPIFEEIVFRGFLYQGITAESRWRTVLAVAAGALFWSVIHLQYGVYEISQIFLLGLALGFARWKSDTLWVPIGMHALVNAMAMLSVARGE